MLAGRVMDRGASDVHSCQPKIKDLDRMVAKSKQTTLTLLDTALIH